jgi:hypothetical protein
MRTPLLLVCESDPFLGGPAMIMRLEPAGWLCQRLKASRTLLVTMPPVIEKLGLWLALASPRVGLGEGLPGLPNARGRAWNRSHTESQRAIQ